MGWEGHLDGTRVEIAGGPDEVVGAAGGCRRRARRRGCARLGGVAQVGEDCALAHVQEDVGRLDVAMPAVIPPAPGN